MVIPPCAWVLSRLKLGGHRVVARVTLDVAVRREFDYLVPAELEPSVHEGTRVKVPFGPREVMGVVTAVLDESPHGNLREIIKTVGGQALVTPPILRLVRWIADYYCCAPEIAMKAVLPDAVRKEEEGWRERLFVRALPQHDDLPKLTKRQEDLWTIVEEWRELPLQELVRLAGTTSATIRKLEDKGLVSIAPQISERDPYAKEHILPTQPLKLNAQQATALETIVEGDIVYVADDLPITAVVAPDGIERELRNGVDDGDDVLAVESMLVELGARLWFRISVAQS